MPPLAKRWQIATPISPEADQVLRSYPPILRQILYNRGYVEPEAARRYLEGTPPEGCEPSQMVGVPSAVERLLFAIRRRQPIAVYGDYDTDGVTATALLVQTLQALGADVRPYIPNRFDEGYGLNNDALASLANDGVCLVVTVDCGIRSIAEAEYARKMGLDLIITDHHHPAAELPLAVAVVNPKQLGDAYPDKDLAGVGLAYKLACALLEASSHLSAASLHPADLLDLVAVGTVADLAPLVGENRALVKAGLGQLRQPRRQGLRSLMGVASLKPERITATDVGFGLGPRLNAAGRLESALDAYRLLVTSDVQEAGRLAQQLDQQNRMRQDLTREMVQQAERLAVPAEGEIPLILFAASPDFNPGVVGLVASRLMEQYYRPALVAQQGDEFTRGSCRSIAEFHITHALDECADLLEHHGGHAAAAGFTIRSARLPEFLERLNAVAQQELSGRDLRPIQYADVELPLSDLNPGILEWLEWLQPTGYGNPQVVFASRHARVVNARTVGKDNSHLKLTVTDGRITYDAIAFRQGHWLGQLPPFVDLMYTFETNEFNGRVSLQLNVRDIRPADHP